MADHASQGITSDLRKCIARLRLFVFDFDGVFTDNMVYVFQDGREAVRCNRSDGIGLRKLECAGVTPVVLSNETNPVVVSRCEKLAVQVISGCTDKMSALTDLANQYNASLEETGFLGNDVNDLWCLKSVGFPAVVQDAHSDVLALGSYKTRLPGGHGAVREVCDLVAEAKSDSKEGAGG